MPAFGELGKAGKPVPKCPYHQQSLATCSCEYAQDWRHFRPKQDPPCVCDDREDLVKIILKLIDLLSQ